MSNMRSRTLPKQVTVLDTLWGIGLVETVNGHTFFLHDGRARNFTEAIMWHGGEATGVIDNYKNPEKILTSQIKTRRDQKL